MEKCKIQINYLHEKSYVYVSVYYYTWKNVQILTLQ